MPSLEELCFKTLDYVDHLTNMVLGNASRVRERHSENIPPCEGEQSELQSALKCLRQANSLRWGMEEFEKEEGGSRCSDNTLLSKATALQEAGASPT